MQIAIVQAEIEDAIRTYILGQININPAMDIKIKLLATRGDDGFRALIDIQPKDRLVIGPKESENYQSPVVGGSNLGAESVNSTPLNTTPPTLRGTTPAERNRIMEELHNAEDVANKVTDVVEIVPTVFASAAPTSGSRDATEGRRQLFAGIKRPVNTPVPVSDEAVSANIN